VFISFATQLAGHRAYSIDQQMLNKAIAAKSFVWLGWYTANTSGANPWVLLGSSGR
jgi:hypothetical protein